MVQIFSNKMQQELLNFFLNPKVTKGLKLCLNISRFELRHTYNLKNC